MSKRTKTRAVEPAHTSYFFAPLYRSVWSIVKDAYGNIKDFVFDTFFGDWVGAMIEQESLFLWPVIILASALGIFTFAIAYVIITLLLLAFFIIAVVVDGLVLLFCGITRFVDMLVRRINGIWTVCYNGDCQKKIVNAVYHCPNPACNNEHRALYPGKYGILKRRCSCGQKMATTFFNGRRKLPSFCPYCGTSCQSDTVQISIPVFGGPSSGKSHIINSAFDEIHQFADQSQGKYSFDYLTDDDRQKNEQFLNALKKHINQKTIEGKGRFDAYKFYFSRKGNAFKHLVYMFDIAGEAVVNQQRLENNIAMQYTKSFLFVLDPLSLPAFSAAFEAENGTPADYDPSESYIDDIVSPVLNALQSTLKISAAALKNASVAIVITKGDIPLLKKQFDEARIQEYASEHPKMGYNEILNALGEEFIQQYQATNFLDIIRMTFKRYQFFVVNTWDSAENKYNPHHTADPFLWLMDMESRSLDLKDRWERKP